jgi:hypothetical protein
MMMNLSCNGLTSTSAGCARVKYRYSMGCPKAGLARFLAGFTAIWTNLTRQKMRLHGIASDDTVILRGPPWDLLPKETRVISLAALGPRA